MSAVQMLSDGAAQFRGRPEGVTEFVFEFSDDHFGPVKALQLFAGINSLPLETRILRDTQNKSWTLRLTLKPTRAAERVLSKIRAMPTVMGCEYRPVKSDDDATASVFLKVR